jgi:hypothetical protein
MNAITLYPDTLRFDTSFADEEADTAIMFARTALGFICSRVEDLLDEEAELWK